MSDYEDDDFPDDTPQKQVSSKAPVGRDQNASYSAAPVRQPARPGPSSNVTTRSKQRN